MREASVGPAPPADALYRRAFRLGPNPLDRARRVRLGPARESEAPSDSRERWPLERILRMPARIKTRRRPDRLAGLLRIRSSGFLRVSRRWRCQSRSCVPVGAIRGVGTRERSARALSATASTGRSWSIAARWRCWLAITRWRRRSSSAGRSWRRRLWMSMTSRRSGSCWSITAAMTSPAMTAACSPSCSRSCPISTGRATTWRRSTRC